MISFCGDDVDGGVEQFVHYIEPASRLELSRVVFSVIEHVFNQKKDTDKKKINARLVSSNKTGWCFTLAHVHARFMGAN